MFSFRTLVQFSLLTSAHAIPYSPRNTPKLQWGPCNETEVKNTIPIDCANLLVPLDYTEPASTPKLNLELARVPAQSQPSKGSILFNFGGPGAPGREGLGALATLLQPLTGGQYDLIAFDPRGTANTIPFSCANNALEALALVNGQQVLGNSSDVALGALWAHGAINANTCLQRENETGSFVGTAFVARDLISVVDALEEDGMLRYWGFSYGTTLGATVAAMFPDRIDKMILDGVLNPHEYYHAHADFEEWTDADKVFSAIFTSCVAAPDNCALARGNKTAAEIEQEVWDLVYHVKYNPVAIGTFMLDYFILKATLVASLYSTASWPQLTSALDMLLRGEFADALSLFQPDTTATESERQLFMAHKGIRCGDRDARLSSLDDLLPTIDRLQKTSDLMWDIAVATSTTCAQWKMDARERYQGDFHVRTQNPVLLIGNTYDALTPLKSAYNVSSGFEGSVVLEVNGYGHASIALPSICTLKTVSAYWLDGTLPNPGTVCEVDAPLYSNYTWADVFEKVAGDDAVESLSA